MKVELQNLTKIFPSRNKKAGEEVVAVNDFTFTIPDGKLVGLLGPSGCGKSTTLYMISGLQQPSSGKIFFGEEDVTEISAENRGIGLVFQNYALYPHLTVKQNILFPLQNLRGEDAMSKEDMHKRAYEVAKLVQIDELMDRKPNELSGGQQQRVAIARALVKMPRILLLDEPLSNLDARLRLQTREEIRRIQKETGITTVFVTHDQEEAMSISDMIVVMKLGVVQQVGKPQEIYDDPTNLFVAKFLGTPPINVFEGRIENGVLYLGDNAVMIVDGVEDKPVYVAIRPEGFTVDENGAFECALSNVEVMGRDVSVVSTHSASLNPVIRSIVNSDGKLDEEAETVKFSLKPHKVFLFDKETEERIPYAPVKILTKDSVGEALKEELAVTMEETAKAKKIYIVNCKHCGAALRVRGGADAHQCPVCNQLFTVKA
ncbi:MAG: ABC transporter ATP-binding protein [Clostridia bacterium]|nr:ABC transporter ATP-binding protein [Clostridia bacterium]